MIYCHVDITILNHEVVRIPILSNTNTVATRKDILTKNYTFLRIRNTFLPKMDLYGRADTTILNHGGFENSHLV